jgi:hypothetical protein
VWYRNWRIKLLPEDPLYKDLYEPVTFAPSRSVRSAGARYTFGFNGATLTILSEGQPALDLMGRRMERSQLEATRRR